MAFMISRETENVHSSKDVEDAFKALTEGADKDFVTEQELYQVREWENSSLSNIRPKLELTLIMGSQCSDGRSWRFSGCTPTGSVLRVGFE